MASIPSSVRSRPSIPALTSLRFFAAAGVVLYHLAPRTPAVLPGPVMNAIDMSGDGAVCFFFILSGFILVYSDIDNEGRMRKTHRDFWRARFARIYPVYFFAFLLALLPAYWGLIETHGRSGVLIRMLIYGPVTALLLQSWLPWTSAAWNAPGWSLSCEAFFYAMFPSLVGLYRWRTRAWSLALALLWVASILPSLVVLSIYHGRSVPLLLGRVVDYNPLLRLPEFVAGMIVGMIWVRKHPAESYPSRKSAPFLGSLLLAIALFALFVRTSVPRAALFPLYLLLIYQFACDRSWLSRAIGHPWLVRLGEASYAIYILHVPVWIYVARFMHVYDPGLLTVVLYLTFITGLSMAVHHLIERPWVRRLRPRRAP